MSVPILLWAERGEVLEIVRVCGEALATAPPECRADREMVLAAVKNRGDALRHAAPELQGDHEVPCGPKDLK
eukprot:4034333-Amphidinium_carterae.1